MNCLWQQLSLLNFSKLGNRDAVWFGPVPYSYGIFSHSMNKIFPECLLKLRHYVQTKLGVTFNSALVNLYKDGHSGVGWHADNEAIIIPGYIIASISIGYTRLFQLRDTVSQLVQGYGLPHGTMITMNGNCRKEFVHRVCTDNSVSEPRINITFRQTVDT